MSVGAALLWLTDDGAPSVSYTELPDGVPDDRLWVISTEPVEGWHCLAEHPQYGFGCAFRGGHAIPAHWDPSAGHAWVADGRSTADAARSTGAVGDQAPDAPSLTLTVGDGGEPMDVWEMGDQIDAAEASFLPGWDVQQQVAEFHRVKGASIALPVPEWGESRIELLREECKELVEAIESGDPVAIMHESADVAYVAFGNAVALGYELSTVLAEIHRANMSKASDPNGKLAHKAHKGTGYVPADVAGHMVPTAAAHRPDGPDIRLCCPCGEQTVCTCRNAGGAA